jgi:pimeloyl-ACP methyl ester carboxylesterase
MISGREGCVAEVVRRGVPALLAFGQAGSSEGAEFEHADLFERISRQREQPYSRLFLHDPSGAGFYRGVSWLRGTIEEVVAFLRSLIAELAPSEIITFGEGIGGHAALVYGALLSATRIVAIEPPSHLIADELALYNDRRWERVLAELPEPATARRHDVPALFDRTGYPGRAYVLFGTQRGNPHHDAVNHNVIHAQRLALSDRVTLCPFPEVGQGLLAALSRRGDAEQVLGSYLFDDAGPPSESTGRDVDQEPRNDMIYKSYYDFKFTICNIKESRGYQGSNEASTYAAAGVVNPRADQRVDDGWRRWIAENLILEGSPENLETTLAANGFTKDEAALEVIQAQKSPYILGAQQLKSRCTKRDWLIAVDRKLRRLDPRSAEVDRRERLARREFLDDYYTANRPVIITGSMEDWPARETWGLEFLARQFENRPEGYTCSVDELGEGVFPLPEYLDRQDRGDGCFRLSPAGSITLFRPTPSNVLLALVTGRQRFRLAASWDSPLFGDQVGSSAPPLPDPSSRRSPLALDQPQILECILNAGEILFLPVGWRYGVEVLEPSATVAFTRFLFDNNFRGPDVSDPDI